MAVYLESEFRRYWYLNSSLDYDGTALWLTKKGTYFKGDCSRAPLMTTEEAEASLNKLNRRLERPAKMMDYLPDWN